MISCYLFVYAMSNTRRVSTRFGKDTPMREGPGQNLITPKPLAILTFPRLDATLCGRGDRGF